MAEPKATPAKKPARRRGPSPRQLRLKQLEALLEVLGRRSRPGERAEELLLDFGLVSDRELAVEIAQSTGRPFEGLRGFEPDPGLFIYVPVAVAMTQRVCPLALEGSVLKLASAFVDPDLRQVSERFSKLSFDISIAPRAEILAAVGRVAAEI